MGPLFSILLVILAISAVTMVAFIVAVLFQPSVWAIRSAIVFVIGAISGVALSGALSILVIGVGATLTSSLQVFTYLSSLAFGGFLGGGLLLWLFIKARRSNPSFKRDCELASLNSNVKSLHHYH